jgi:peptidoglycan/LPS O-acetylase OafA/YrhL
VDGVDTQTPGPLETSAGPAPRTETARARFGYQPALDGIRAVAVALVLLFHYRMGDGRPVLAGGFLGVDIFFVLSGFLITTLLLEERLGAGRIGLRQFYARRALRLFPPLAVLLVAGIVALLVLEPGDSDRPEWEGIAGAAFYYANWLRIVGGDLLGMLDHTWSLSIEEQFYLVFPLVLVLVMRRRVSLPMVLVVLGALTLVSFAVRLWIWTSRPEMGAPTFADFYLHVTGRSRPPAPPNAWIEAWDRVYFGSDTRAETLLVGALLAVVLTLGVRHVRRVPLVPMIGIGIVGVLVAAAVVDRAKFGTQWLPVWGTLALEAGIVAVIASVVVAPRAHLARVLALPPLVWLGRRSYAIYLFHLPVFVLVDRSGDVPLWVFFVGEVVLVLALAELSFRAVERPAAGLRRRLRVEGTR